VRLLLRHPLVNICLLTGESQAGKPYGAVFPHLAGRGLPDLVRIDEADWSALDFVFCALPHGTTQSVIAALPDHLKVVDLSADFRLADPALYAEWYGHAHQAVHLQPTAVYGLTELARPAIQAARLVANPGCYPTAVQLPLAPLLSAGLIETDDIIIDAKSGVSGAGREAKQANLYSEVTEGIHPYGIASHRHLPEIEQELSRAARQPVQITFTPHLMPMSRGMLATIYVRLKNGVQAHDLRAHLHGAYMEEPFVRVLAEGAVPATRHVRGSNHCHIGAFADRRAGRAIVVSVIDNLVKGASGQAIQNMNLMTGQAETLGLEQLALFP
jgi:N-acetyl-gamma-glutamyl-phosphate reductase